MIKEIQVSASIIKTLSIWLDEERFEDVARASPNEEDRVHPKFWAYKGYANWKLYRYFQATDDFSEALKLQPSAQNTLFLRGRSYEELDRYPEAICDYKDVLKLNTQTADAHAHLGFCLERSGKPLLAWHSYMAALEIDPGETLALAGLKALGPSVLNA